MNDTWGTRFRILDRLGEGGMGEVYRAEDVHLHRIVAVKLLANAADGAEALLAEARATASLNHPNIAVVHEVVGGDRPCIIMEYVPGETLLERIARGPLPVPLAVDVACQVASALEAAHAVDRLHGDLTSANVRVTPAGRVKVLDFGLARGCAAAAPRGTLAYLSPERLAGGPLGIPSDIFSFGVLLYEMLTGHRPFKGDDPAALATAIQHSEPRPLAALGCEAPLELEEIVRRALRKDPRARPATAREPRLELEALRARLDAGKPTPGSSLPAGAAFRGLVPFQEADSDRFFGRGHEISAFLDRITHPEFQLGVLFGDSGCGKTSLLRAGLIPRLWQRGDLPLYCRSYRDPLAALVEECRRRTRVEPRPAESSADYFHRVADHERATLVLICDQFEEFFVSLRTAEEREPFLSFLSACYARRDPRVKCLLAIRGDCLHFIAAHIEGRIPDPLISARLLRLGSFDPDQAQQIIEESARRGGLVLDPGFARHVARELAAGDRVLPSELQIVGERLQTRRIFDVTAYARAGGKEALVHGFLDDVLAASGDRDGAALLLRSLISDEDTRLTLPTDEITRRTQRPQAAVSRLLRGFVDARLVREIQEEEPWRYELMHEYLIERINRITGRVMDATQRANRLLRRYLSELAVDSRTRVPLRHVRFIRRYSDLPRGEKERRLLAASFRRGVVRATAAALLLAAGAYAAAAALSVTEEWEEAIFSDGHTAAARRVVFSPDGRLLASSSEDRTVIVWDFARRERVATLTDHTGVVSALTFSQDGKWLVSGGYDRTAIVWETAGFTKAAVLSGHTSEVAALGFSLDGRLLASTASETILWEVGAWRRLRELPRGFRDHGTVFFAPDDRSMFIKHVSVDLVTGAPLGEDHKCDGHTAPSPVNTRWIASLDGTGYLKVCDIQRGLLWQERAHRDHGRAIAWSPDGRWIATGSDDTVLWDSAHRTIVTHFDYPSVVWSVAFSPDSRWLVSSHGDGSLVLWDVAQRARVARFGGHGWPVRAVAFAPDGRRVASGSEDRSAIVWDVETRRKEAVLVGHSTRLMGVAFVPGRQDVVSADQDNTVIVWDVEQRRPRIQFADSRHNLNSSLCLAISPDGRWVANGYGVYRVETGERIADLEPSRWGLAFSPDGRWLALPSHSPLRLDLRDTHTWRPSESLPLGDYAPALAFSADSRWLVAGHDGGAVRLFALSPLREVALIGRHGARVKSVAFSPDGRQVASAGDDRTIALWDVGGRRLVTRIGTHTAPVLSVAFSPDGRRLVSGEHDHSVRLYTRHRVRWGRRLD